MTPPEKINYKREFLLTFSNRRSLFSSKKIERFIVFTVMLILSIIYIGVNILKIEPIEFVEVIGLWLFYGGYSIFMSQRDKGRGPENQEVEQVNDNPK